MRSHRERHEGSRARALPRRKDPRGRAHTGRGSPRVEVVTMSDLRVRVPASSANLGPGFDSFAIALPLLAEYEVRPARAWSVSVEGDQDGIPTGDDNLFIVGARAAAKAATESLGTYHVTQRSAIPVSPGLGSTAPGPLG